MQEIFSFDENSTLVKVAKIVSISILLSITISLIIFFFGPLSAPNDSNNPLFDSFRQSPQHAALLRKLIKSKQSILYGKKQDGLFQFAEHFANQLSLTDQNVFVEDISDKHFKLYRIKRAAAKSIEKWLGLQKKIGVWLIYSKDGRIVPQKIINKIHKGNLASHILIVTTSSLQKNVDFKQFSFPPIDPKQIKESMVRNLSISKVTADILMDYFQTPEKAFSGMDVEIFNKNQFLGDNYRSLEGLSKQNLKILQELCAKGEAISKKENVFLTEFGVAFYKGKNYWLNPEARLNYELHKNRKCKNEFVSEDILKLLQKLKKKQVLSVKQRKAQTEAEGEISSKAQLKKQRRTIKNSKKEEF